MGIRLLVDEIDEALRSAAEPGRADREKAYLRSELDHYGTRVPAVRAAVKAAVKGHPDLSHDQVLALTESLWAAPVHERRLAAVELLNICRERLDCADVALLERLLRQARTWALVDPLAASVGGNLVGRCPSLGDVLDLWSVDDDFWIRRSALLALLGGLRRGEGDFARFARYADAMLGDRQFFIQKAIGWVLRETAKKRPSLVFEWLLPRATQASGVTIREAVKPLDEHQRQTVLAARRP